MVGGTTISSTVFNALTADLATGLTTAVCKDGQTTTTASIPFAQGVALASTKKLYLDGVAATGNTYIVESSADVLDLVAGGTTMMSYTATIATLGGNVALGANYISRAGTAAGLSLDASNNATLSGTLTVSGASISTGSSTALSLATTGGIGFQVQDTASIVNRVAVNGAATGANAKLFADGSDTDVGLEISSKGADPIRLMTNQLVTEQVRITHTASADRYITLTGSNGGNCVLSVSAGYLRHDGGVIIGADSTNNLIDDASTGAGTATLYIGNASINVTSDERVKSNIKPLDDGLGIVRALTPVEFDQDENRPWGNVRHYVGFTAQDIHEVAPWAVNTQGDTGLPWQARYEFLIGPMVRAMQQLTDRLEALEARL